MSTRRLMTLPLKIWKKSFYSSDLTTYPKIIFQLFFYNKARRYRSVISKYRPRNFIIDCDEVLFPFFFNKFTPNPRSGFFSGKEKKKNDVLFPSPPKKRVEGPPDRRLILTSTTPLLPSIIIERRPLKPVPADSSF